jgi:hypothetical protein
MKQLSDLLDNARAETPPARYDLDDVVAAGRRRQRRRATGWATATSVAVAAAIGLPQVVTPSAAPAPRPAATSAAPAARPAAVEYTFAGFTTGEFEVVDPTVWQLSGETAEIHRSSGTEAGSLTVFRPGVDPISGYKIAPKVTDAEPVNGRRAFHIEPATAPGGPAEYRFAWEYADDALAVVAPTEAAMTRAELRQVAEAFTTAPPHPVTLAFRVAALPDGYKLVTAAGDPRSGQRSVVNLVPEDVAKARLAQPGRGRAPGERAEANRLISIRLSTGPRGVLTVPDKPGCADAVRGMGGACSAPVAGSNTEITVLGGPAVSQGELRKVLDVVEAADPARPATWWPVSSAIPASALLTG